jgi:hypothetical protein
MDLNLLFIICVLVVFALGLIVPKIISMLAVARIEHYDPDTFTAITDDNINSIFNSYVNFVKTKLERIDTIDTSLKIDMDLLTSIEYTTNQEITSRNAEVNALAENVSKMLNNAISFPDKTSTTYLNIHSKTVDDAPSSISQLKIAIDNCLIFLAQADYTLANIERFITTAVESINNTIALIDKIEESINSRGLETQALHEYIQKSREYQTILTNIKNIMAINTELEKNTDSVSSAIINEGSKMISELNQTLSLLITAPNVMVNVKSAILSSLENNKLKAISRRDNLTQNYKTISGLIESERQFISGFNIKLDTYNTDLSNLIGPLTPCPVGNSNVFVTSCNGGVCYSYDAENWVVNSLNIPVINSVWYSPYNKLWILCGSGSFYATDISKNAWEIINVENYIDITSDNNGTWAMCGGDKISMCNNNDPRINSSWSQSIVPLQDLQCVRYGNGIFLAGGKGSINIFKISSAGVRGVSDLMDCLDLAFGNNVWIAVGSGKDNSILYSSDNGESWAGSDNTIFTSGRKVVYGNNLFVVLGTGVNTIAYSQNGVNWIIATCPIPSTDSDKFSITYNNRLFIACIGPNMITSTNGINWYKRDTNDGSTINGKFLFSTQCAPCIQATYNDMVNSSCKEPMAGYYTDSLGSISPFKCPEGYFCENGTKIICKSGTYQPLAGQSTCDQASPGYYAFGEGLLQQMKCDAGTYQPLAGQPTCVQASPGYYAFGEGLIQQTKCDAGTYQPEAGQTSCTPVSQGYYSTEGSETEILCPAGSFCNKTSITPCPIGSYNTLTGQTDPTACVECPFGLKTLNVGSTLISDCISCPAGSYIKDGECILCPEGSYSDTGNSTSFIKCPIGTFSNTKGGTSLDSCISCPAGSFSGVTGATSCNKCPVGTYNPNTKSTSIADCLSCGSGFFAPEEGSSICTKCDEGSLSNPKASSCVKCPAGHRLNSSNICQNCGEGEVLNISTNTCGRCNVTIGLYATGSPAKCETCPAGFVTGTKSCTPCLPGWFSKVSGNQPCTKCPLGTTSASGATECETCPLGSTLVAGATICTVCPAGSYINNGVCTLCPRGYFSDVDGSYECIPCSPGTFSNLTGRTTECQPCFPGQVSNSGSTLCTDCLPGTYSNSESTSCSPCLPGTYSKSQKATSCSPCLPGTYSNSEKTTLCSQCFPGTFSNPGSSSCTECSPGTFSSSFGSSLCTACSPGSVSLTSKALSCTACSPGTYSTDASLPCVPCPKGTISANGQASCTTCPAGTMANTNKTYCNPCPTGQASVAGGDCTACPAGTTPVNGICQPCDANTTSVAGGVCTACPAGTTSRSGDVACTNCLAGTSSTSGEACKPCPVNTYSVAGGVCQPCPAPTLFSPGGGGLSTCKACPGGSFIKTDANGNKTCDPCQAGWISTALNSTSCTACPVGTSTDSKTGASSCTPCPVGTSNSTIGAVSCTQCGPGKVATTTGQTTCSDCFSSEISNLTNTKCVQCTVENGGGGGFGPNSTKSGCEKCKAGSYSNINTGFVCTFCPRSTYSTTDGATSCAFCAGDFESLVSGATSSASCKPCGNLQSSIPGQICKDIKLGLYDKIFPKGTSFVFTLQDDLYPGTDFVFKKNATARYISVEFGWTGLPSDWRNANVTFNTGTSTVSLSGLQAFTTGRYLLQNDLLIRQGQKCTIAVSPLLDTYYKVTVRYAFHET